MSLECTWLSLQRTSPHASQGRLGPRSSELMGQCWQLVTTTCRDSVEVFTLRNRSRSPVLLRISTPLAGGRALCEVAKTATLAAHHSHSVDCKAERVRPGKCGND